MEGSPGNSLAATCSEESKFLNAKCYGCLAPKWGSPIGGVRKQLHLGCKRLQLASFSLSSFILHEVRRQRPFSGSLASAASSPPLSSPASFFFHEDCLCSLRSWLPNVLLTWPGLPITAAVPIPVTVMMPPAVSLCLLPRADFPIRHSA